MLLQCEDNVIRILPALPKSFKNGAIRGLKAKGDITVDIAWQDGRLIQYTLESPRNCTVTVATPYGSEDLSLSAGTPKTVTFM
jgi:alpha-L-fucosidase 2